jgi:hypothetical protein
MNVSAAPRAAATPAPDLATRQARAEKTITRRLHTISTLESGVTANTSLSADQKTALLARLSSASGGLSALKDKIAGDTDPTALKADAKAVFTDYRVYKVLAPQVDGAERITAMQAQMAQFQQRLSAGQAVVAAATPGDAATTGATLLAGAGTHLTAATTALDGTLDALLAVTPSAYNSDAHALDTYRSAMGTGSTELGTVDQDLTQFAGLQL